MSDYDYDLIAHTCSSQEITRVMKEQDATIKQLVKNDKLATVMINQAKINDNTQRDEIKRLKAENSRLLDKVTLLGHSIQARNTLITKLADSLVNFIYPGFAEVCPNDPRVIVVKEAREATKDE